MSRLPVQLLNKFCKCFPELWPFENLDILNLSAQMFELEA